MASVDDEERFRNRTQQSPLASQRAKEQAKQEGGASRSRFANAFPLGYKDTFAQWVCDMCIDAGTSLTERLQWQNVPAAVAEHNVLSFIPYLQSPPTQTSSNAALSKPTADGSVEHRTSEDLRKTPSATAQSEKDPYGPRRWHSNLVKLSGRDRALNEFSVERVGEDVNENLVMIHGYGAGLAFFGKNFEMLSRSPGWKVYALDLLGMGRSSRPPWRITAKDRQG